MTGNSIPPSEQDSDFVEEPADSAHQVSRSELWGIVSRFIGLGSELAGYTLLLAGIGYWIDTAREHSKPYGTAIGALVGFSIGMIRVVQIARQSYSEDDTARHGREKKTNRLD